jgi:hypothetical protein
VIRVTELSGTVERPIKLANREFEDKDFPAESQLILARVTDRTAIPGAWARWVYKCEEVWVGVSPTWGTASRPLGRTFNTCLSVSELSNGSPTTFLSYGVSSANLLGSFVPRTIPDQTVVAMFPHRAADGTLIHLIVNTQAIDGTCVGQGQGADLPVNPGGGGGGGGGG